jgi:signal peptidase II
MTDTPPNAGSEQPPAPAPDAVGRSVGARIRQYQLLWIVAACTYAADQLTKAWIMHRMPVGTYIHSPQAITVIDGFCYFVHQGNAGAAWSMLSGHSGKLAILAGATLVAIFVWRHALGLRAALSQIAFGLLCGGIAGNLTDRLRVGHVTDFIDLHFGSYIYPTFNVADSGICVGVILYVWQSLKTPAPSSK